MYSKALERSSQLSPLKLPLLGKSAFQLQRSSRAISLSITFCLLHTLHSWFQFYEEKRFHAEKT
jgi:hypothetical protein